MAFSTTISAMPTSWSTFAIRWLLRQRNSAHIRNWSVAKLAEEVYFTQFDNTSSLSTLHYTFKHYGNTPVHILE